MPNPTAPKLCRWCDNTKSLDDFYTHPRMLDGHLNKCKECVRSYQRHRQHWKIENDPEWRTRERKRSRKKFKAGWGSRVDRTPHYAVSNAIRDGRLIPAESCEDCGHDFTEFRREAHHDDYSKPLDVHWLCSLCHGKRHRTAA